MDHKQKLNSSSCIQQPAASILHPPSSLNPPKTPPNTNRSSSLLQPDHLVLQFPSNAPVSLLKRTNATVPVPPNFNSFLLPMQDTPRQPEPRPRRENGSITYCIERHHSRRVSIPVPNLLRPLPPQAIPQPSCQATSSVHGVEGFAQTMRALRSTVVTLKGPIVQTSRAFLAGLLCAFSASQSLEIIVSLLGPRKTHKETLSRVFKPPASSFRSRLQLLARVCRPPCHIRSHRHEFLLSFPSWRRVNVLDGDLVSALC